MAEALILEFTGVNEADYAAVNKHLGIDMHTGQGEWPPGLIVHAGGTSQEGTLVVTEIWSSRTEQEAFLHSRLGEALAAAGITAAPSVRWVSLVAFHQPGG